MIGWLEDVLSVDTAVAKLIATVFLVVVLAVARWVVLALVHRHVEEPAYWYRTRKILSYLIFTVGVLITARIWVEGGAFGTWIGLFSAGLAIALSDVLKNLAGWFYIVLRRPFRVGDRIEVAGQAGDVVDIRAFRFSVLEVGNWVAADQSTGRIIHVPNGILFTNALANYTEGFPFIWHEIPVLVTFESDWRAAEAIVLEAIRAHSHHPDAHHLEEMLRRTAMSYQIRYRHVGPAVYLTVRDSGVLVTGRMLVEVRRRREAEADVWKLILERLAAEPSVDLAYPTVRTYLPDRLEIASAGDRPG